MMSNSAKLKFKIIEFQSYRILYQIQQMTINNAINKIYKKISINHVKVHSTTIFLIT